MRYPSLPFRTLHHAFLVLLLVGVGVGCQNTKSVVAPVDDSGTAFPEHSADAILGLMQQNLPSIAGYRAEASLAIKVPAQSGNFSADITHRQNDSLYITISPGMGIEAVRALITPDSFFVHDRINREMSFGSIQFLRRILPFPAASDTLYAAMLGMMAPDAGIDWELSARQSHYIFTAPNAKRIYTVDPTQWRVVRYEERTSTGQLLEERTYAEFAEFDGKIVPRRITFRRPVDDAAATLYFRKLDLNPGPLSFPFHVSSRVKRVPIGN